MRSAGLATWKAPAAMKRMWSVRTMPYLVVTEEPSTIGEQVALDALARHLGAGTALAAGDLVELVEEDDAGILHPANGLAASPRPCRPASGPPPGRGACAPRRTRSRRCLVRWGSTFDSMSRRLMPISSMFWPEKTSTMGMLCCLVSMSTMRSSRRPARSWVRSLSRVASAAGPGSDLLEGEPLLKGSAGPVAAAGDRAAALRPAARRSCTAAIISAFTMLTPTR